ncbi:unnamed protein product [Mucor hiemalis]
MDQLSGKLERLLSLQQENTSLDTTPGDEVISSNSSTFSQQEGEGEEATALEADTSTEQENTSLVTTQQEQQQQPNRADSPPPAFSSSSHAPSSSSSHRHEAPPSYETSVLSTIKALNSKLCLYESHIYNRHKSPKWLAKRADWISRVPNSIEEVAYQLVQLEMALLWTAVTESWIQERETWLTLVASARSERHLAGAIINLERHTLVMDEDWSNIRDRWINDLLEMVVLPLSHG